MSSLYIQRATWLSWPSANSFWKCLPSLLVSLRSILIVLALALTPTAASSDLLENGTYFERNALVEYIATNRSTEVKLANVVGIDFRIACITFPNGLNIRKWAFGKERVRIRRFLNGEPPNDWDIEALYRIILINDAHDAIVWSFDERLFSVRIDATLREQNGRNCIDFANAFAVVSRRIPITPELGGLDTSQIEIVILKVGE